MNHKNAQKCWSFAGLFIIALVLSMPFYSAEALAANVQVTKNQGESGIDTFLDGKGDVWALEALISGSGVPVNGSVIPNNVKVRIGDSEAAFTSCSQSTLGQLCQYISPLTDGVKEGEYAFQVVYSFLNSVSKIETSSAGGVIRADGSAPQIFFSPGNVRQNEKGEIVIDFTVNDKKPGLPSVGLKQIDIVNVDTGAVLQTIVNFQERQEEN